MCWAGQELTGAARRPSCIGTESTGGDGGAGDRDSRRFSRSGGAQECRIAADMPSIGIRPVPGARQEKESWKHRAIAAMASSNAAAQVQQEASVEVLRKALDIQGESACSCCRRFRALPRRRWAAPLAESSIPGPERSREDAPKCANRLSGFTLESWCDQLDFKVLF